MKGYFFKFNKVVAVLIIHNAIDGHYLNLLTPERRVTKLCPFCKYNFYYTLIYYI